MKKIDLLVIDPQFDFCDPEGALYVPGADQDMKRLSRLIKKNSSNFNQIYLTLDSHHFLDVAHPIYWQNKAGLHPEPFTEISLQDVKQQIWQPSKPEYREKGLAYLAALEKNKRYPLVIWPYHCMIGSQGQTVFPLLLDALSNWECRQLKTVCYFYKGSNIHTEHYSAIQADVPDPDDPGTMINQTLMQAIIKSPSLAIAGQAGSHCVANTVRDIMNCIRDKKILSKMIILEDAISPVSGYEKWQQEFLAEVTQAGVQLSNTQQLFA